MNYRSMIAALAAGTMLAGCGNSGNFSNGNTTSLVQRGARSSSVRDKGGSGSPYISSLSPEFVPNPGNISSAPLATPELKSDRNATNRRTFHFTGASETFRVPSGVARIIITAKGAGTPSARGGLVKGTINVKPGDVLTVIVGGSPNAMQGGFNGGGDGGGCAVNPCQMIGKGGAGASDVRLGGTAVEDRILVAGGAGGRGGRGQYHAGPGGEGGGLSGELGDDGVGAGSPYGHAGGGGGGGGGTQSKGGKRGAAGKASNQHVVPGVPGAVGTLAIGGTGAGNAFGYDLAGGAGGGGGGGYYGGGGGGSGANVGYYEGGGGSLYDVGSGGGGGGGSSFVEPDAKNISIETGKGNAGDGLIVIRW